MARTGRPRIRYRTTELGVEVRCSGCHSWWPADREFFYMLPNGQPHSWCKACYIADRAARRAAKVAGITHTHETRITQ